MASTKYYDTLPTTGNAHGRAFRDIETEEKVLKMTQQMGIGAQFGGKYFCHDVRVIRLPRHGARWVGGWKNKYTDNDDIKTIIMMIVILIIMIMMIMIVF